MKKVFTLMMTAILALSVLTGCGGNKATGSIATDGSTSIIDNYR